MQDERGVHLGGKKLCDGSDFIEAERICRHKGTGGDDWSVSLNAGLRDGVQVAEIGVVDVGDGVSAGNRLCVNLDDFVPTGIPIRIPSFNLKKKGERPSFEHARLEPTSSF